MSQLANRPLCFIDCETTGLDPQIHEIIDFAACKVSPNGEIERLHFKILPENIEVAQAKALEVNGYTKEKWEAEGAISMTEALPQVVAFIQDTTLAGQNPSYDKSMIETTVRRRGFTVNGKEPKLPYHCIDTVTLAYEHLVPWGLDKLSLANVCEFLDIPHKKAHTAMGDVLACEQVLSKLLRATVFHRAYWGFRYWLKKRRTKA